MNVFSDFRKCCIFLSTILFIFSFIFFSTKHAHSKPTQQIVSINDLVVSEILALKNPDTFALTLSSNGKKFDLTLKLNKALLEKLERSDQSSLVLYKGEVNGVSNSWVRLSDNDGVFSGAIYDGKELYFVDPVIALQQSMSDMQFKRYASQSDNTQVLYKASDLNNNGLCGTEEHNQSTSSFDYQKFVDELSVMANSLASREINVALVADTEFNTAHGGNAADRMLIEMNIVDGIFSEQVNVQMSVVYSSVLSNNGALTMTDAVDLVYAFRDYTNQQVGNPGVTHLFTGKNLDSNTVGIAFVSALCTTYGVGVTQNLGSSTALVAAHEFGHNFGAPHDNQSGSACSSSPGGFLMNPSINGSNQFSNCSLVQMDSHINQANSYTNNQCVVNINASVAPTITSTPDFNATTGFAYRYDNDNSLDVSGTSPITFNLDFSPPGMTIDANGTISWIPIAEQVGSNSVQITANNIAGSDTQNFDITVWAPLDSTSGILDFNTNQPASYAGIEDVPSSGMVTIEGGGATLAMTGNRWQQVSFPYSLTANTILELDFKSATEAEVQGIGFDDDLIASTDKTFQLFGTESFGINDFSYSGSGNFENFVIPIGQYYTGDMLYMFFVSDQDDNGINPDASFSNIKVYEQVLSVDFTLPDAIEANIVAANQSFSVQASVSDSSNVALTKVEFSLDQTTWFLATNTDGLFQYDSLGPVGVGEGLIYARLNDVTIQSFPFSAQEPEVGYYFVNPDWVGTTVNIYALADNTSIVIGGVTQILNTGELITHTLSSQGEYIFANKVFSVGTDDNGLDLPVPTSFMGTEFVVPHVRDTHFYNMLSPEQDALVSVQVGENNFQVSLLAGVVFSLDAGTNNKTSAGIIISDQPIVLSHSTNRSGDSYPVHPANTSLWGIRSTRSYIAALEDETSVSIYSSEGMIETFTLNAGELVENKQSVASIQGQGNAISIVANKPISAIQHADGDGLESSGFWSIENFANEYVLPVNAQYIAIACNKQTTVTLYNAVGDVLTESNCISQGSFPGKVYFENITAGTSIIASQPIYLMYETESINDEHNLLGLVGNIEPLTLSYYGLDLGTDITPALDFIAQGTPNLNGNYEIFSVEFSLDEETWFVAEFTDGIYQYNFSQLPVGQYTLFARLNGSSISLIVFDVVPEQIVFGFGYFFIDQKWVNEIATIYAIADNTNLLINGNTVNLNKNESLNYSITFQGESISADKQFSVGALADALDLPVPSNFLGTQFIVPNIRKTNYYNFLSPHFDTTAEVQVGLNSYSISLSAGEVYMFSTQNIEGAAGRIESVLPILVSHSTIERSDSYPVPPISTELWGIRSKIAHITAFENNTNVTVYAETGELESFTLDAGEVVKANIGSNAAEGLGSALHIISDNPIAAIQIADTDGAESTSFWATEYFSTNFVLPVPTQYVAIVCSVTTSISLYDPTGTLVATENCVANNEFPGKAYFGSATDGENIAVGSSLEADNLIYLIYESSETNDESNLAGYTE